MEESGNGKKKPKSSIAESQLARLGSFLIASSFLVVAFIQLIISDSGNELIPFLVNAVAGLGTFIAAIYGFMNFWDAMPKCIAKWIPGAKPSGEHLVHTWGMPFSFMVFWIVIWIAYSDFWCIIPIVIIFLGVILAYEIIRNRPSDCNDAKKTTEGKKDDS